MATMALLLLIPLLSALTACSDDPEPTGNFHTGNGDDDDVSVDAGADIGVEDVTPDADIGVEDVTPDADVAAPEEVEIDTGADAEPDVDDEELPPVDGCAEAINLGELEPFEEQTVTIDFDEWGNQTSVSCDNAVEDSNEAVLAFRLPDDGVVTIDSEQPLAMGLRVDDCYASGDGLCREEGINVSLQANLYFFVVIEKLPATGEGEIELEIFYRDYPPCDASEHEPSCVDDEAVETCQTTFNSPDIERIYHAVCPMGCYNDRCVGDTCDAPIAVDASMTLQGGTLGYYNEMNSYEPTGCEHPEAEELQMGGREFVVELADLTADQEVTIEWSHSHNHFAVLQIKEECDVGASCLMSALDEDVTTFYPPEDGNYFLIFDSSQQMEASFDVAIDIEEL